MADNHSILNEIKKMLGPDDDYDHFDVDIIVHINSAFNALKQLGVGPEGGFHITGATETWDDFWQGTHEVPMTKYYIWAKVKLSFDPPSSSFAVEALKEQLREYEWRANVEVETPCFLGS